MKEIEDQFQKIVNQQQKLFTQESKKQKLEEDLGINLDDNDEQRHIIDQMLAEDSFIHQKSSFQMKEGLQSKGKGLPAPMD